MTFSRFLIITLSLTGILIGAPARAQTLSELAEVSLTAIPSNPSPGQTVQLSAQSLSIDLSQATLSWTYGGKKVQEGVGARTLSVVAPASGTTALATVTVSGFGLSPVSASILLNPGSIDVLWEAVDAYTPPFYKGKALVPVGGTFRTVAIAAPSSPKTLTYTWSRNGSALQSSSGLNRSSVTLENTIYTRQETLSVTAYSGTFQGAGSVTIPTQTPSVIAYQKQQGFTNYARGSLGDILIGNNGTVLRFEPYFFSLESTLPESLKFSFAIDDTPIVGESLPNELRISRPQTEGTHELTTEVGTLRYTLQRVVKTFNLIFR